MENQFQAIATILSLINPAICVAIFAKIEKGQSKIQKFGDSAKSAFAVGTILLLAAFFGTQILGAFGISIDAFKVAGGGVLAWMGFSMLSAGASQDASTDSEDPSDKSLSPLILFAASPGTITGVITVAANHTSHGPPWATVIAVVTSVALMWLSLVLYSNFGRSSQKESLVRDTATRFMGLIVVAMGIQFVLSGVKAFFG